MLNRVLIPLDGSELAERAISYGKQILEPEGQIILLTVIEIPERVSMAFYPAISPVPADERMIEDQFIPHAEAYLYEQADTLRDEGLNVHTVTVVDEPAAAIIRKADEFGVDAIVMSTHGRSGLGRWLFGSVTSKVLSVAEVPVFVVPGKGHLS
jgi:nucleotide-binding universal stress UspA family protein